MPPHDQTFGGWQPGIWSAEIYVDKQIAGHYAAVVVRPDEISVVDPHRIPGEWDELSTPMQLDGMTVVEGAPRHPLDDHDFGAPLSRENRIYTLFVRARYMRDLYSQPFYARNIVPSLIDMMRIPVILGKHDKYVYSKLVVSFRQDTFAVGWAGRVAYEDFGSAVYNQDALKRVKLSP